MFLCLHRNLNSCLSITGEASFWSRWEQIQVSIARTDWVPLEYSALKSVSTSNPLLRPREQTILYGWLLAKTQMASR